MKNIIEYYKKKLKPHKLYGQKISVFQDDEYGYGHFEKDKRDGSLWAVGYDACMKIQFRFPVTQSDIDKHISKAA